MQSPNRESRSSYQIDASALSGFVREPFERTFPALAPTALPEARGFATARSGAFNLQEVVSVSSAYTLVAARTDERDGSILTLATAVVEDLNILEVVTARRIVAQLTITFPPRGGQRRISLAGSRIEGLRLAGHDGIARLDLALQPLPGSRSGPELPLAWNDLLQAGQSRATSLFGGLERLGEDAEQWATDGHIVDIPGYGKLILGELNVTGDSVQLVSMRAELCGLVTGEVIGPRPRTSGGSGSGGDQ